MSKHHNSLGPPSDGIGDVAGTPRDKSAKKEAGKWERFKSFFGKKLRKGVDLGESYASGEVSKKQSEVRKNLEQAAKLAAERKNIQAEEQLKKQKEVQEFSKSVDNIFADDGLPIHAKKLKLAKLIDNNPGIEKQIHKINAMIEKLSYDKGLVFELRSEQKALAEGPELPPEVTDTE